VREFSTIRGSTIGHYVQVSERVSLKRVVVGDRAEINAGTYIEQATIEDDVQIGPNCSIVGVWHPIFRDGAGHEDVVKRITIARGALIGAGVIVTPGVTIGARAVIGAGTLVTKDVPERHMLYGRPGAYVCIPLADYARKQRSRVRSEGEEEY
jgi:acetyltransferase-like isoleucine patch superfamily enzyme